MGAWGTGISSNDTFADIYDEFFELYNEGMEVQEISKRLIETNHEIIEGPDDCNNFWFALAKAQWECKQLDNKVFNKVKDIIESDNDIEVWQRLEASEEDLKKRRTILAKFLTDLQQERPKPKQRKKKIIRQPPFEKGDCLVFKLSNGNYGGAVVLEAVKDSEFGHTLIALTRINKLEKPIKKDFENAEVMFVNFDNWKDETTIRWYLPLRHKKIEHLIDKIDNLDVEIDYNFDKSMNSYVADFDIWFIDFADKQFKAEQIKQRPEQTKTIKELTKKKSKWKFW